MKIKLLLSLCLMAFISTSAFSQTTNSSATAETASNQKVSWESQNYDFGDIAYNIPAEAEFEFTNTSNEPVVIAKVKSSCGCTVSGYDKNPILPGEKSTITATYNAKKKGSFRKNLTVYLSDNSHYVLTIKGQVSAEKTVSMN